MANQDVCFMSFRLLFLLVRINVCIFCSVDNKPTENLDQFIEVVKQIPDRERIPVEFSSILDIHTVSVHILTMERHWTKARLAVRNGKYSAFTH